MAIFSEHYIKEHYLRRQNLLITRFNTDAVRVKHDLDSEKIIIAAQQVLFFVSDKPRLVIGHKNCT